MIHLHQVVKKQGCFLIPLAPGIEDTPIIREKYFNQIVDRFEKLTNQSVKKILYLRVILCK